MARFFVPIAVVIFTMCFVPKIGASGWSVDIESGAALNGYNDVRIPGDTGTQISLTEDLDADVAAFFRVRLGKSLGERHRLSVLIAPLRITASGRVDREIAFNGVLFAANEPLTSHYRFDSYRLSYTYTFYRSERLRADIGFTGKIRDASIELRGENQVSEKSNTGFVPLINFAIDWRWGSGLGMVLKGDALAAPQGRAEDVLAAIYGDLSKQLRLRVGYRILEGGADNDTVYNFTAVHYVSAGLTFTI